jgi:hypothetical protein
MILIRSNTASRRLRLSTAFCLVLSFLLSRMIFWFMGVRYDSSSLGWFWQYLDIEVLRYRLLPGLLHLHAQPPGFNLFLGLVLKLFPHSPSLCFHVIYIVLGFVLYCLLYYFLRRARFSRPLSLLCAFCFIVSPNSILYENWLFYTYPVAVLLVLAAVALRRFQDDAQPFYAGIFLFLVALICITRSAFHFVFVLPCAVLVLIPNGIQRRKITFYACVAVCVVSALYMKNLYMFGFFGASSWKGMNMAKVTVRSVAPEMIDRLVKSGSIPSVASLSPFSPLDQYPEELRVLSSDYPNAPELTSERKANGELNFNHVAYIAISREYDKASGFIIRHYPRLYLSTVGESWLHYLKPSWQYFFIEGNTNAIQHYISIISFFRERQWIDLRPLKRTLGIKGQNTYPVANLLLLPPILLMFCMISVFRMCRLLMTGDLSHLAYLFMTYTIMYVAVVGNMLEIGSNNRFRVETDPLVFLLTIVTLRDICMYTMALWRKLNDNKRIAHDK